MTAHDTPRTDERAGLSEALGRVRMYLAAEDDPAEASTGAVAWCEVASQAIAYPLWLSDLRAVTDAADRLAAAVARAEAAEAVVDRVTVIRDELCALPYDEGESDFAEGYTTASNEAGHSLTAALAASVSADLSDRGEVGA